MAQHALGTALAKLVGPEAGRLQPFALSDADAVRELPAEAGFHAIEARHASMLIRWPPVDEYLARTALGSPSMHAVMQTLVEEMRTLLAAYIEDEELVVPHTSNPIVARRYGIARTIRGGWMRRPILSIR